MLKQRISLLQRVRTTDLVKSITESPERGRGSRGIHRGRDRAGAGTTHSGAGVPRTVPQVSARLSPVSLELLEAGTVPGSSVTVGPRRLLERGRRSVDPREGMNDTITWPFQNASAIQTRKLLTFQINGK